MQAARFATSAARSAPSTVAVASSSNIARASSSSARSRASVRTTSSRKGSPDPGAQASSSSPAASAAPLRGGSEGRGREFLAALCWSSPAGMRQILSQAASSPGLRRGVGASCAARREEAVEVIIRI